MRLTYDAAVNAAYIYLSSEETASVARTYTCDPENIQGQINLDFDDAGRLVGIEILGARAKLAPDVLIRAEATAEPAPHEVAPT